MEPIRQQILDEARTWLRTPWHHMARVKGAGVDCAQFLIGVYSAVGIVESFDTGHYPHDWMLHKEEERFLSFLQQYGREVAAPQPGDAVVYKIGHCFSHGGIVVDWPGEIIHAWFPERMVVQSKGLGGMLAGREHKFFTVI